MSAEEQYPTAPVSQTDSERQFPTDFPGNCPPSDAIEAEAEVYRIVKANPHTDGDFLSHAEMGTALDAPPCLRCGVSVFSSFSKAQHRQKLSPRLGAFIAKAQLSPIHGKTSSPNGSGHITWWSFRSVSRSQCFEESVPCL